MKTLYVNADPYSGAYGQGSLERLTPDGDFPGARGRFGHGCTDFFPVDHFVNRILGDAQADIIDVYEAMDMFLPGHFAYRSILLGGVPMEIPDPRDASCREKYRNDTLCTDPAVAGDSLVPPFSKGKLEIHPKVYALVRQQWQESMEKY